jgi:NDP-sugar pyrophosphorylase family protein
MAGSEIIKFKEKPKHNETFSNLANAGIYILEPKVLDLVPLSFYDFSKDLFPNMLAQKKKICGVVTHEFWRDVGRPEDYLEATHYFLRHENLIGKGCQIEGSELSESCIGDGCKIKDATVTGSVLFEGTWVGKGSRLKDCIIGSECTIGDNVDIWPCAVIGDNVDIGNNVVIKGHARIGPDIEIDHGEVCDSVILPEGLKEAV